MKARRAVSDALARRDPDSGIVLVATGSYLGEGFDWPELDTLFLAFPLAFKGRVVQYVGRLLRTHTGKYHVELHDYVDSRIPVLDRMHTKRHPAYTTLGFDIPKRPRRTYGRSRYRWHMTTTDLDDLIEEITVDAYGDEGYWSFLQALTDDAEVPLQGTIAGAAVRVEAFDFDGNERRGITARVNVNWTRGGPVAYTIIVSAWAYAPAMWRPSVSTSNHIGLVATPARAVMPKQSSATSTTSSRVSSSCRILLGASSIGRIVRVRAPRDTATCSWDGKARS